MLFNLDRKDGARRGSLASLLFSPMAADFARISFNFCFYMDLLDLDVRSRRIIELRYACYCGDGAIQLSTKLHKNTKIE